MDTPSPHTTPRSGRCAIVGRPNVGKSTLLNALLGQKLVIATPTPGTTRSCVIGVHVSADPPTQIAFVDTPGMGQGRTALARLLSEQARGSMVDADVVVLMTDVDRRSLDVVHPLDEEIIRLLEAGERPAVLALNKVDRLRDKKRLLPLIQAYTARHPFAAAVPVSATTGDGLEALIGEIRALLPEGMIYDEDVLTDRPERFFAAELVREAALLHTRDEVPHGVAVWIDDWSEEDGRVRIAATLAVEKPSHKKIVVGARGRTIRSIGTAARLEIERLLGRRVFLELWVKIVPGWTAQPAKARRMLEEGGP
ncbi:MAG: GTPase Era [Myxococcota bacterium]